MKARATLGVIFGALLAGVACSGEPDARGRRGSGDDDGGSGGTGGGGGGLTKDTVKLRCEVSNVGPRLLRRQTQSEFDNTIRDIFPEILADYAGARLGTDPISPLGFSNDAATLVVANQTAREILSTAEDVAELVTSDAYFASVLPCSAAAADQACAAEFIGQYGSRLFRRPLSADEQARYLEHYDSVAARSDFATGVKWALVGLMQSPHAVYRSELGEPAEDGYALNQYEIATQLAYTFSGTTPSAELLGKARAGELDSPEALVTEARALLATAQGRATMQRFFREWSHYPRVADVVKTTIDGFGDVAPDMVEETRRFIEEVVFNQGGDVRSLLTANFTVMNDELAAFYGYGVPGGDFARVERPAEWGVGLLAQGSVLAGNAQSDSSSPTLRGLVVTERLFCNERPKPPANVPRIEDPQPGAKTTRQRFEESHNSDDFCNSCHRYFDPPGFAFEHFDEVGRYRADEGGLPIDTSATMIRPEDDAEVMSFDGLGDLAAQAAANPEVTDCVSGLLTAYAFSGGGGVNCLAESARTALAEGEVGLAEFMARLAAEPHFTRRE